EEEFDQMIATNVKGILNCSQAVAPHMIQRRYGKIVNVSSVAGLGTAVTGTTPYAATKAAVMILTKRMAFELGPHGINVNCVCPGFTITDATTVGRPDEVAQRVSLMQGKTMLGRNGTADEIGYAMLFLAS